MSTIRSITAAFVCCTCIANAQSWQQLPSFPGTPRDDAASFMIGDHIYVGTGMEVGWGLTNDWWRFDVMGETWEPIASLPSSPRQYCAAFTVDGNGYLFGGIDANGVLNELWAYDPTEDEWTQKAPLPAEARSACAASEGFGYGIVATGMLSSGTATNEAWKYHPNTDAWEQIADVPGPPRHRAAGFLGNAGMVIAGGADQDFNALADVYEYPVFFEIGEWLTRPEMPAPRYGHRGASFEVVIGGASATTTFHDDVWRNMGSTWHDLPDLAGGLRRGGVAASIGNDGPFHATIYFGLGLQPEGGDFIRMNDWWKLTYPLSIDEQDVAAITVFPNPAQEQITIHNITSNAGFMVLDVLGRSLTTGTIANGSIDVSSLAAGRYTLQVEDDGRTLRSSFIKIP